MAQTQLTPKRAAYVLLRDWINGNTIPLQHMQKEEMTHKLADFGYKVTEKRREKIIEQADAILATFKKRVDDNVQKFAVI